jgi:hypothetical protein
VIKATLWARDKYEPAFNAIDTRRIGTERAVELWAASALAPIVTTRDCYHRDVASAPWIDLVRTDGTTRTISPEVIIVPSVGELGWTP